MSLLNTENLNNELINLILRDLYTKLSTYIHTQIFTRKGLATKMQRSDQRQKLT